MRVSDVYELADLLKANGDLLEREVAGGRFARGHGDWAPELHPRGRGPERPVVSAEHRMQSHALATEPPNPERVYWWREKMSATQRASFETEAGDLLIDLGYDVERSVGAASAPSTG
jgi:hypothetical protein